MTDEQPLYPADEQPLYPADDIDAPEDDSRNANARRNRSVALSVVAIIVIIVLALLMLRSCGSLMNSVNRRNAANEIVPVEGARPVDGKVSVWLAAGADLQSALLSARVKASDIVDMGGGRFVLTVTTGREVDSVRALQDVKGVDDAGRVYSEDATPAP